MRRFGLFLIGIAILVILACFCGMAVVAGMDAVRLVKSGQYVNAIFPAILTAVIVLVLGFICMGVSEAYND
jgi:hypothetical protein